MLNEVKHLIALQRFTIEMFHFAQHDNMLYKASLSIAMNVHSWNTISTLVVTAMLLAACGAPSDADLAARQQQALVATVAAAPTASSNTITNLDATSAAVTAQPVFASAMPLPTVTMETEPTTVATDVPPSPTASIATAVATATVAPSAMATIMPSVVAATSAPQALPTEAASPVPPTPAPPTEAPLPPSPAVVPAPPVANDGVTEITFSELYSGASVTGPILSEKAASLNGSKVVMVGYMAPPLKPDLDFFVLTKDPMVYCPFCSSASDWPFDIVFVRMANGTVPALTPTQGIRVTGTFQTGTATDPATGFVSQIRIIADRVEVIE